MEKTIRTMMDLIASEVCGKCVHRSAKSARPAKLSSGSA